MSDSVLDVRSARALLRRRSRLLAAAAVLGLAAGAAYVALVPPTLTSTTLVLLPTPTALVPERDVSTQVEIATSSAVLTAAGRSQRPALEGRQVSRLVEVEASTDQLLKIHASSVDATHAQALSQAVAEAYVTFVREADRRVTAAVLSDLNARSSELQDQIEVVQKEVEATIARQKRVRATSPEGRREAQLLAGLRTEQADLSLRLDKVKGDIATAAPVGSSAAATSVLQDASPAVGRTDAERYALWLPAGAAVATGLAALVMLVLTRRDPRMGLRDEIADALGTPVLGAVRSRGQRSVSGWRTLLATYDAPAVDSWAFRQVLRALAADGRPGERKSEGRQRVEHPDSVLVVSLAGDGRGLAVGPQVAAFVASLGIDVALTAARGHDRAAALWAACSADEPFSPRDHLVVAAGTDSPADLRVVLAVLDRRSPSLEGVPRTASTVVAVAATAATAQELARLAVAIDDSGRRIDGVLVADADRADRTSGRHTLDQRAGRIALPVRLTGAVDAGGPRRRS